MQRTDRNVPSDGSSSDGMAFLFVEKEMVISSDPPHSSPPRAPEGLRKGEVPHERCKGLETPLWN